MEGLNIEQIRAAYSRWLENPDEDTTIGQLTAQAPNSMERLFLMRPEDFDWRDSMRKLADAAREEKRQRLIEMRSVNPVFGPEPM